MKTLTIAAAMLALLAVSAYAEGKRHRATDQATDASKKKVDDKAYTSALSKIPDPKQEFDPWQGVRVRQPVPPAKAGH